MGKRIIVCCDGTSNTPYMGPKTSPATNVSRIARYIETSAEIPQIVFYQSGIGTRTGSTRSQKWRQAWGIGIRDNIKEAYMFLCVNYAEGDDIILVGFSRGAFTVRCIVDFVATVGLLTKKGLTGLEEGFDLWWNNKFQHQGSQPCRWCDKKLHIPVVRIKACAIWDTVNSVGTTWLTGSQWDGPRRMAPSERDVIGVDNVFHALALHEERAAFSPVGIAVPEESNVNMEQCWFSGYHGDIGGGNENDALAHFALIWMMSRLQEFVAFDFRSFWENEMGRPSWRLREDSSIEISIQDTMTTIYRRVGVMKRSPAIWFANGDSRECIHRSVAKLMFPSQAFRPCWALEGLRLSENNGNRFWYPLPRQDHPTQSRWRRYLPWSLDGNTNQQGQDQEPREVSEAPYLDIEGVLTRLWAAKALRIIEENAQEADIDPGTLLGWVHQNFEVSEEALLESFRML